MNDTVEKDELMMPEQVARHVRKMISSKTLKRGEPLPSYRELASEMGVAVRTAMRGMDLLVEQGIVRRQKARGCYVNRELSAQGRSLKTVGIIHTASYSFLLSQPYLRQIMQGIGDGQGHLDVQIFAMRKEGFVSAARLGDRQVDGVILLGVESDAFVEEFSTWGVPGVLVDQVSEKLYMDCVACDNEAAARDAVQRLVGLGHRHIRYVGHDARRITQVGRSRSLMLRSSDRLERRAATVSALTAMAGVQWEEDILSDGHPMLIYDIVTDWQKATERPTVFLAEDEPLGRDLIREFTEHGVKVPEDVSVCVLAQPRISEADGTLTGCGFDFVAMGRTAAEVLRKRCEEPATAGEPGVHRIGCEWMEGSSTREARA
jgi:DNA-binding LacI/PurR family transcriptional regulator